MPELTGVQRMLWAKARDAGLTLPNDSQTANLSKSEVDRLKACLERGEDAFGRPERQKVPFASSAGPGDADGLIPLLERIADAMSIAAR